MNAALTRFRVAAYVVGVFLLLLVAASIQKWVFGRPGMSAVVSPIHGFLYMVYIVIAFDLGMRTRWKLTYTVLVLLAGTVPFLSFVMERRVTDRVRAIIAAGGDAQPADSVADPADGPAAHQPADGPAAHQPAANGAVSPAERTGPA